MEIDVLAGRLAVCRLDAAEMIPPWATSPGFLSITRTNEELSLVCDERGVPEHVRCQRGFVALKVRGPLDFGLTGVLAGLTRVLAEAAVPVFVISTYDTDYIMVHEAALENAVAALVSAGHHMIR